VPRHSYSKTSSENLGAIYWLLIAAIIICCLLMVSQRGEARLRQTLQSTSDDAVSPLIGLISKPMRGLENFLFSVEDRQRAFEEITKRFSKLSMERINVFQKLRQEPLVISMDHLLELFY